MATQLKRRRGNTAGHASFTGAQGEFTFNTDTNRIHAHDGSTEGGHPHALLSDIVVNVADSGAANAIVVNSNVGPAALVDGLLLGINVFAANTGACTVNYNSAGAVPLVAGSGAALVAGAVQPGMQVLAWYRQSLGKFLLLTRDGGNPQFAAPLPISQGGTGANTLAGAQANLGITGGGGGGAINYSTLSVSTTLTSTQSGTVFTTNGFTAAGTITLPANAAGQWFAFYGNASYSITISAPSGSIITPDGTAASTFVMPLSTSDRIYLLADGTSWRAITAGRAIVANAVNANEAVALGQYSASFATTGYQKFPNGYMLQWGTYVWTGTGARTGTLTFPIAFPNQCLKMWSTDTGSAVAICAANPINASSGNLFMPAATLGSSSTPTTTGAYVSTWIAFGN